MAACVNPGHPWSGVCSGDVASLSTMGIRHSLVVLSVHPLTSVLSSLLTTTLVGSNITRHPASQSSATAT
eukprot:9171945-Ditylum_brightwellii.AAC.1